MLPPGNTLFKTGLKAQIEVYCCRYFEQVFSFYKILQVYTTKRTKQATTLFE